MRQFPVFYLKGPLLVGTISFPTFKVPPVTTTFIRARLTFFAFTRVIYLA